MLASFCSVVPSALALAAIAWAVTARRTGNARDGLGLLVSWGRIGPVQFSFVLVTVVISCGAVYASSFWRWRRVPASFETGDIWVKTLVALAPTTPFLMVELEDGTVWRGRLWGFDSDPGDDHRFLSLATPLSRKRASSERFTPRTDQAAVLLPESRIVSIQVRYPNPDIDWDRVNPKTDHDGKPCAKHG